MVVSMGLGLVRVVQLPLPVLPVETLLKADRAGRTVGRARGKVMR